MRRLVMFSLAACLLSIGMANAGERRTGHDGVPDVATILLLTGPASIGDALTLAQACCKICRKGKACGDSCIARSKTCTKPPGCACDAQ